MQRPAHVLNGTQPPPFPIPGRAIAHGKTPYTFVLGIYAEKPCRVSFA